MGRLSSIAAVSTLALAPLLACGQSGTSVQGSVNQALGDIAKGVAAQAWSGTITITQSAKNGFSKDDKVMHTSNGTQEATNSVVITLTKGIAVAKINFALHENTDQLDHYDDYDLSGNVKEDTVAAGTNGKDASIKVSINDDGTYEIEYTSGGIDGRWDKVETSLAKCKTSNCQPASSHNTDTAKVTNQGFVAGGVHGDLPRLPGGKFDMQPKVLTGLTTEPFDTFSGSPGRTTINWNLSR